MFEIKDHRVNKSIKEFQIDEFNRNVKIFEVFFST